MPRFVPSFRLWHLLLSFAVLSVPVAIYVNRSRAQQRFVEATGELGYWTSPGDTLAYEGEMDRELAGVKARPVDPVTLFLLEWLPQDFILSIEAVRLPPHHKPITDEYLALLCRQPRLTYLKFGEGRITRDQLSRVKQSFPRAMIVGEPRPD